jgi:outer membrane lipoprotein-sorting protein
MIVRGAVAMLLACILGFGSAALAQEAAPDAAPPVKPKAQPEPKTATKNAGTEKAPTTPAADMAPTWYAQVLAQGPGGLNVTQFWSKGSKLRAETVVAGHKIVTIVNGEWYTAYDATKGLGIRVRRTEEALANDAPFKRPFGNEAVKLIKLGAEKIRDESFHGRPAAVYQLTDRLGRRTIWTAADALNMPLRIEFYNRRTAAEQTTDFINWLTGLVIPDGFFVPEPRIDTKSYEFAEYARFTSKIGGVGPVPVLYMDLLRGH